MLISEKPVLSVKENNTKNLFPSFVVNDYSTTVPFFIYWYYRFLLFIIHWIIKARLLAVGFDYSFYSSEKDIHNDEVEKIYNREARMYEKTHHLTTNFRDTWWRRQTGMDIVSYVKRTQKNSTIRLLDLATGIGLSLEEMTKVFDVFGVKASIVGLDYNAEMLAQAEKIILPRIKAGDWLGREGNSLRFVRGDARYLVDPKNKEKFVSLKRGDYDCVTMMFGIGGVDKPVACFESMLDVLKVGGVVSLNDMHRPVHALGEHWPFFIGKKYSEAFQVLSWQKIVEPLILQTLWGWRDTSALFYILPFVTAKGEAGDYYGFKEVALALDNENWWYGIPAISTARIVLEKEIITHDEYTRRRKILDSIWVE